MEASLEGCESKKNVANPNLFMLLGKGTSARAKLSGNGGNRPWIKEVPLMQLRLS